MSQTYQELKVQYSALMKTFKLVEEQKNRLEAFYSSHNPRTITFIGCGSSYYISQSFEIMARVKMGVPTAAIPAGDLMLHYEQYREMLKDTLIVVVSRSGSTSEIINAVENVKSLMDVPVLAVTCMENSGLEKLFITITSIISICSSMFGYIFNITNGGPGYESTVMEYLLYIKGFRLNELGYASAIAIVLLVTIIIITSGIRKLFAREEI